MDNIPGVDGFGIKTAARWIQQFGSVKSLIERLAEIPNPKVREAIRLHAERIIANLEMVRLDDDLPLPVPLNQLAVRKEYAPLIEALKSCEFKSLLAEVEREALGQQDLFQ